jgi:drug/metabolite transporter (DMT)-like permease
MRDEESQFSPILFLVIGVVSLSVSSILVRLTTSSPLIIALYRQLFCAVLFLPFVGREQWPQLSRKEWLLLVLSGFFLALHFASWITGLLFTTVARAALFVDLQPIWGAMLAAIFLKERLSVKEVLAILVVTIGGVITVVKEISTGATSLVGDGLALFGGFAGATYFLIGRGIRNRISWTHYMFAVYGISTIWLLIFNLVLFQRLPVPAERDILWIFLMAVGPGILGHGLLNLSLRYLKTYVVNTALLGEPVLATILAYWLFSEKPTMYFFAGSVLIFIGLIAIFRLNRER